MKAFYLVFLSSLLVPIAAAQPPELIWKHSYGGPDYDYGYCVRQTSDGGYILAGHSWLGSPGQQYDISLIKTDSLGNPTWQRYLGGTTTDFCYSVRQTVGGGYIVAGKTGYFTNTQACLIRTDSNGYQVWQSNFGGFSSTAVEVNLIADGGYIVTGYWMVDEVGGYAFLRRLTASGSLMWSRLLDCGMGWTSGNSVQQTTDGGFMVVGGVMRDFYNAYLIKTNTTGDTLWTRSFGGPQYEEGYSGQQTSDGGYILAGYSGPYGPGLTGGDVFLVKTDSSGNSVWQRTFGGNMTDVGTSVQQTTDGGYIVAGYSNSFSPTGSGYFDVYLIKTDPLGNLEWQRTWGGNDNDYGRCVRQAADGGYVIAGYTFSYGAGNFDMFLFKTQRESALDNSEQTSFRADSCFILDSPHPNPFNASTALNYKLQAPSKVSLKVYDTAGRLVTTLVEGWRQAGKHQVTFDGSGLASGIYLAQLKAGEFTDMQKLMLLK
jgi:hypothetical protein